MRDSNRIPIILNKLGEIWNKVPDWRLGQLFNNLQTHEGNDMFYCEDEAFIHKLEAFIDDCTGI